MRAAVYTRISLDREGQEFGVQRQEADCRELADRLGYDVGHVFVENDTGASTRSRKARPQYAEMLRRARTGEFGAILAYSNSRLTRRPREVEDLLDLAERHGVKIKTVVSGEWNLSTADGRAVARTIAAWDAAEAERTAERVTRAFLERAQKGKTHGRTPYGWRREEYGDGVVHEVLDDDAAAVIRETADRLLKRETLRSIWRDLNERNAPSPRGGAWDGTILRQIMLRERNAGRRTHRGQIVAKGAWPSILDEGTHDRVVALLRDPSRSSAPRKNEVAHLLSGLAVCGRCGGGPVRVNTRGTAKRHLAPAYVCTACHRIRRKVPAVDMLVERVVVGRLSLPDGPVLLGGNPEVAREAEAEAEALTARLNIAADQFADGKITGDQLGRVTARLRPQIDAATARARAAAPVPELAPLTGDHAAEAWSSASLDVKRAVIDMLMVVTILPGTPGRGAFDPESVRIDWRKS